MFGIQNLIGFVLPPVIDLINTRIGSSMIRFWISLVVCLVVAVAVNFSLLKVSDIVTLLGNIGIIFSEAQIVYKTYWGNSSLRDSYQSKIAPSTGN
jgi:hypothetical protein